MWMCAAIVCEEMFESWAGNKHMALDFQLSLEGFVLAGAGGMEAAMAAVRHNGADSPDAFLRVFSITSSCNVGLPRRPARLSVY